jgi:hypothetical protein
MEPLEEPPEPEGDDGVNKPDDGVLIVTGVDLQTAPELDDDDVEDDDEEDE